MSYDILIENSAWRPASEYPKQVFYGDVRKTIPELLPPQKSSDLSSSNFPQYSGLQIR